MKAQTLNPETRPELSGERLREIRSAAGMSKTALAFLIGVDYQTIGRWERDQGGVPHPGKVDRLAEVLDCTREDLIAPATAKVSA